MDKHYLGIICLMIVALFSACAGMNQQVDLQAVDLNPKLQEGHYLQKVDHFAVILDASQSMTEPYQGRSKFLYAKEIASQLNQTIPDLKMGGALVSFGAVTSRFGTRVVPVYGLTDYVRGDLDTAMQTIVWPGGLSPLASAMDLTEETLTPTQGKLAVIIISDGKEIDNAPVASAAQMKKAFDDRLCIYTVAVGDDPAGIKLLEEIAAKGECGISVAADDIVGPQAMAEFVERVFLARDTDLDGVPDDLDECPDTPKGVKVNEKGCPFDTDGDGVYDYLDQCPDTPKGVRVDEKGCPLDSDADGVYDYLDQCPDTPLGVEVDEKGCPLDSDKDGVYDYLDECPDTPMGVKVDEKGCPLDSDGDGVFDYLDQCPGTPKGAGVDERGCWSLGNVLFDFEKADIKPGSHGYLDEVAEILEKNPSLKVEIQGHTDNVGSAAYNEKLSIKRAKAVMDYLKSKGISADRLPATGYGFSRPVASNDTDEGRAKNRRTEFHPIYRK